MTFPPQAINELRTALNRDFRITTMGSPTEDPRDLDRLPSPSATSG